MKDCSAAFRRASPVILVHADADQLLCQLDVLTGAEPVDDRDAGDGGRGRHLQPFVYLLLSSLTTLLRHGPTRWSCPCSSPACTGGTALASMGCQWLHGHHHVGVGPRAGVHLEPGHRRLPVGLVIAVLQQQELGIVLVQHVGLDQPRLSWSEFDLSVPGIRKRHQHWAEHEVHKLFASIHEQHLITLGVNKKLQRVL